MDKVFGSGRSKIQKLKKNGRKAGGKYNSGILFVRVNTTPQPLRWRGVVKRKSECYCKVILHTTLAGSLLPLGGDTEGNTS